MDPHRITICWSPLSPPCPTYESGTLLEWLNRTIDNLTHEYGGVLITLGGYLNSLDVGDVAERTAGGLYNPMVIEPTRGKNINRPMFMVSMPDLYQIKITTFVINTDHKAIVAKTEGQITDHNKRRVKIAVKKTSPEQHANLLSPQSLYKH